MTTEAARVSERRVSPENFMKSILVTGAAGFIGSHLTDRLLRDGWAVTGLDNFDPFYAREIKRANLASHAGNPSFDLVEADIRDPETWPERVRRRYDAIVHLAAR